MKTAAFAICLFCASLIPAQSLDSTLQRMDKSAAGFRGLTARIKKNSHTHVINDDSIESGNITLLRPKPKDLRMLVEFSEPQVRAVAYENRKVQIFYPKINTVQEYDLGKQSSLIDQFLLLGFGTSGGELTRNYDIKYGEAETVAGTKAERLELTPKSAEARQHVRRIDIWVGPDGVPVQQKVYQPSKDYVQITYTDIKVNPALPPTAARLQLPKGVKKETPQK
jgi:outer membrane lipoprotein-sorting protein